jgi:hypothetical protein
MKNGKPVGFFGLSLDFSGFHFFYFSNFQKKLSQPVFSEPIKPVRTGFDGFRENRPIFIDIVIHVHSTVMQTNPFKKNFITKLTIFFHPCITYLMLTIRKTLKILGIGNLHRQACFHVYLQNILGHF